MKKMERMMDRRRIPDSKSSLFRRERQPTDYSCVLTSYDSARVPSLMVICERVTWRKIWRRINHHRLLCLVSIQGKRKPEPRPQRKASYSSSSPSSKITSSKSRSSRELGSLESILGLVLRFIFRGMGILPDVSPNSRACFKVGHSITSRPNLRVFLNFLPATMARDSPIRPAWINRASISPFNPRSSPNRPTCAKNTVSPRIGTDP
mmetsp:Transcript_29574/g.71173  ORF Transcript_29574/g.71173 Transcript_29574/m.71173 type:complete len:207 (+) Transcript_29574:81-701(+)